MLSFMASTMSDFSAAMMFQRTLEKKRRCLGHTISINSPTPIGDFSVILDGIPCLSKLVLHRAASRYRFWERYDSNVC
jgi:hypothetical protein